MDFSRPDNKNINSLKVFPLKDHQTIKEMNRSIFVESIPSFDLGNEL